MPFPVRWPTTSLSFSLVFSRDARRMLLVCRWQRSMKEMVKQIAPIDAFNFTAIGAPPYWRGFSVFALGAAPIFCFNP